MNGRLLRNLAAAASFLALSACASFTLAPAGPFAAGGSQVTLGRSWTDLNGPIWGLPKGVRLLTIDGPLLNRLYIADGLKAGEVLVRATSKERPTPAWRAGLSPNEQVEFVADSISAMDYQRVETSGLRPAKVAGADGMRFDITAKTPAGLEISGLAQIVETGDRLYLILYLAPSEHYFAATRAEAESIMDSARMTP